MRKEKGYDRRAWLTGGKHTERARKAQKRFASHSLAALREAMRRKEPLYTELVLRHTAHIAGGLGQFAQMLMHYVETHGNPTQQARASLVLLELMKVNAELDAVRAEQRTSDDWSLLSDEEVDRRAEAAVAAAAQTRIDSLVAAGELCRVKKS